MDFKVTAHQKDPINNELNALSIETHSPSSALIHSALKILQKTEIGYGNTFTITPRSETAHLAIMAAREMEARCPSLLAVILDAITANKQSIIIEIPNSVSLETKKNHHLTGHEIIQNLPKIIQWLMHNCENPEKMEPPS